MQKRKKPAKALPMAIDTMARLKAIANPLRLRLLEQFAAEPATTKQVATRMGLPITRLYHHVSVLEEAGLLTLAKTRKTRGATEKYYTTTAETLRVDQSKLGGAADKEGVPVEGLSIVDSLLSNAREEVRRFLVGKQTCIDSASRPDQEVFFAGAEVRVDAERLPKLRRRIDELLEEFERESEGSGGSDETRMRLLLGWYPLKDN